MERRQKGQRTVTSNVGIVKRKAVYLRKSRDETNGKEDILAKHRMQLVELCGRNGWEYVIYQEIGSSDSLDNRPKMMQLLNDAEDGLYDAIVVMEYDRLSRGGELDAAHIKQTFRKAGVKVITPTKVYDLDDDDDELHMGFEALIARSEYLRTKRRFQRGKVNGAKQGKWVQGPTPFPYVTAPDPVLDYKRIVVVDEEQRPQYQMMLSDALAGKSPGDIAIKLNVLGVKTNRDGTWVAETVQRVLLNPFHMGRIVYGMTKKRVEDGHTVTTHIDRDEWVVSEGNHERLKTPEQHARLVEIIASRRRIAPKSHEGKTPLSGLVKCGSCGKTHQSTIKRGEYVLFACTRKAPTGAICSNCGVHADVVYQFIQEAAARELETLAGALDQTTTRALAAGQLLDAKRRQLHTEQEELSRLVDFAISGLLTKDMFAEKQAPKDAAIRKLKEDIAHLEESATIGDMPVGERKERLAALLEPSFWTDATASDKDKHTLFTSIVDHIKMWSRHKGRDVELEVVFR